MWQERAVAGLWEDMAHARDAAGSPNTGRRECGQWYCSSPSGCAETQCWCWHNAGVHCLPPRDCQHLLASRQASLSTPVGLQHPPCREKQGQAMRGRGAWPHCPVSCPRSGQYFSGSTTASSTAAALDASGAVHHLRGALVVSNGSREHDPADPVPCQARKECLYPAAAEMPGRTGQKCLRMNSTPLCACAVKRPGGCRPPEGPCQQGAGGQPCGQPLPSYPPAKDSHLQLCRL